MKVTIEIRDELYRQVKAKSALEGRAVREVTERLFERYVDPRRVERVEQEPKPTQSTPRDAPHWFGIFREEARRVKEHDLEAMRESIARGIVRERNL